MKRKVAAGVAATVAVASVATNLAFKPEELLHDQEYLDSHFEESGEPGEAGIEYTAPAEPTRMDAFRAWIIRMPVAVKAAFLMPLWVLGALPVALGTSLFSAVSPILAQFAGLLLQLAVLVGIFCAVYKLIFPNRKLRELFNKKNRWWLFLGAFAVVCANFGLSIVWPAWSVARVVLMIGVGFGVMCLLWHRICGKLKPPAPAAVQNKLLLEY